MERFLWLCGALALAVCASFQAPETKPKIVAGVLLSASDRKPLPEYTFVLEPTLDPRSSTFFLEPGVPRLERLTTDAAGRFQSAQPFPLRTLSVTPVDWESTEFEAKIGGLPLRPDFGSSATRVMLDFSGKPLELLIPSGPTFDVILKHVEIEKGGPALAASSARLIATTPGVIDEGVALTTRVRTLDPDLGWVRFAPLPSDAFAKPHGAKLEIVALDGRWKAVADVSEQLDKGGRRVELEWKACTSWSGTLRGVVTNSSAPNWVSAERLGDEDAVLERRRVQVEWEGNFRFVGLDPGRWRVTTRPLRAREYTSAVRELTFEKPVAEAVDLERIEATHRIDGRALGGPVVKQGSAPAPARVILRRPRDPLPLGATGLTWTAQDERWIAEFSFAELPAGDFELDLVTDDAGKFLKTTASARSDGPSITFEQR